jgi:hypothetical protein
MKYGKLMNIVKSGNIVIPIYIYKEFSKLDIDLETFIFLMYIHGKGNNIPLDVNRLSEEFLTDVKSIMNYISILQKKKLIEIKVVKNEKNVMEEFRLGTKSNITKVKKILIDRDLIEMRESGLFISDPVFQMWFKRFCL